MKNFILLFLWIFVICFAFDGNAQFGEPLKSNFHIVNEWNNGGGEYGRINWSETGSGSILADTSVKLRGKASIKFTSAAANDYIVSAGVSCKNGPNCLVRFWYYGTSSDYTAYIYDASSNLIQTLALPAVTGWTKAELSFVAASPTTLYSLRVQDGDADAQIIYIDEGYLGANDSIGSINLQDKMYDLTTACSGSTCLSSSPAITATNRGVAVIRKTRDGSWWMDVNVSYEVASGSRTGATLTISGATFKTVSGGRQACTMDAETTTRDDGFTSYANSNASTITMSHGTATTTNYRVSCSVELNSLPTFATDFPSEQVVRAESANQFAATKFVVPNANSNTVSTTGNTAINFSMTRTNYGVAQDPTTSGDVALKIPQLPPGKYFVTFAGPIRVDGPTTQCLFGIGDGTTDFMSHKTYAAGSTTLWTSTVNAFFEYTTTADRTFTLKANSLGATSGCLLGGSAGGYESALLTVTPVTPQVAMPQIVNSVGTSYQGQTILNSVRIGQASETAKCTSSPCGQFLESGDWVSSITRGGAGSYTLNLNSGVFTSTPICSANSIFAGTAFNSCMNTSSSASAVQFLCSDYNGNAIDEAVNVACHGIK